MHLVHHVSAQLICRVVVFAVRLLETEVAARERYEGVAVRLGDGNVSVVLVRVNVEMVWLVLGIPQSNVGRKLVAGQIGRISGHADNAPSQRLHQLG